LIADWQLPIADWQLPIADLKTLQINRLLKNRQSAIDTWQCY